MAHDYPSLAYTRLLATSPCRSTVQPSTAVWRQRRRRVTWHRKSVTSCFRNDVDSAMETGLNDGCRVIRGLLACRRGVRPITGRGASYPSKTAVFADDIASTTHDELLQRDRATFRLILTLWQVNPRLDTVDSVAVLLAIPKLYRPFRTHSQSMAYSGQVSPAF